MNTTPVLDREAFVAWLRAKDPGADVGLPASPCNCPIAKFLRESGTDDVAVWHDEVFVGMPRPCRTLRVPNPPWARRFIAAVDCHSLGVTRETALDILAGIS